MTCVHNLTDAVSIPSVLLIRRTEFVVANLTGFNVPSLCCDQCCGYYGNACCRVGGRTDGQTRLAGEAAVLIYVPLAGALGDETTLNSLLAAGRTISPATNPSLPAVTRGLIPHPE